MLLKSFTEAFRMMRNQAVSRGKFVINHHPQFDIMYGCSFFDQAMRDEKFENILSPFPSSFYQNLLTWHSRLISSSNRGECIAFKAFVKMKILWRIKILHLWTNQWIDNVKFITFIHGLYLVYIYSSLWDLFLFLVKIHRLIYLCCDNIAQPGDKS